MASANQQPLKSNDEDFLTLPTHQKSSLLNNFFKIGKFNEERSVFQASLHMSMKYLLPILLLNNSLPSEQYSSYLLAMQSLLDYIIIYYPLIIFNKFLIVATLIALYQEIFLLSKLTQQMIKIFRNKLSLLIEIDFHISMVLLSLSILPNLPNCLLSFSLYNFSCIYLENYINKDDYFYCASCKASFAYRLLITVGYILNAVYMAGTNENLLKMFILIYTTSMALWYYRYGYKLYPNRLVKGGMTGFVSLLLTANILILEKYLVGGSNQLEALAFRITISFITILFCFSQLANSTYKMFLRDISITEIKEVLNQLLVGESPMEQVASIYGLIQMHKNSCQNINCELHSFDLFSQKISLHDEQWGISTILKSYFRCLYESKMDMQDSHTGLLEYLQSLYSEINPNPFKMAIILPRINLQYLDIFDKASLYGLKCGIEKIFKAKMDELYDGNMHFQQLLTFDKNCSNIEKMINFLVKSSMKIYKHLQQDEIDLNIVFQRIRENLYVEKDLNNYWGKISKDVQYNRQISIIYLYYKQFIKNERVTRKDLLFLQPERTINEESVYLFNPKSYDPSILFQKETIIFTCYLHQERLLFKDMNYNFQHILKYSKQELVSVALDKILPDKLKKEHQNSFQSWLHSNLKPSYSDTEYDIKDTECLTKDSSIISVFKYFKVYLSNQSDLEFVCLLKANKKPTNASLKIEYIPIGASQPIEAIEEENNQPGLSLLHHTVQTKLTNENAIFIKEKQFQPNSKSRDIIHFKYLIFAFSFLIALSLVAFHLVTVSNSQALQAYAKQYITFMQFYRIPMILGNSYLQNILQVGNQTKIAAQIIQLSSSFATLQSNQIMIETIFDPTINVPAKYLPYSQGYTFANKSIQFDQMQLLYVISSSIATLRAPIDRFSMDFLNFDQLITPSYDNMINGTKNKFHDAFVGYINQILQIKVIIEVAQAVLCVCFFVLMVSKVSAFMNKMKLISDAIVNFKSEDLSNIKTYWKDTQLIFRQLFLKVKNQLNSELRKTDNKGYKGKNQKVEQYMNRISKRVKESKHFKKIWIITVLEILIGTLLLFGCVFGTEISRESRYKYLVYFESQGYLFLKYFPAATIVGYGCLSKYRSIHFPNETSFDPSRFDAAVLAMKNVGQYRYIPSTRDNDSLYFKKQKNYYFGNPCRYNPSIISAIGVNQTTCETIMGGSFTSGLTSEIREAVQKAKDYINGVADMNSSQLVQFSTSVVILSAYVLDAINTWGFQYNEILSSLIFQQMIFTSTNAVVLAIIVGIVFMKMFLTSVQREYQLYRYMFMKMIPEYILKVDKVARQTFINFNILQ